MRRLVTILDSARGPIEGSSVISIDGLEDQDQLYVLMDKLCGQNWGHAHSPREFARLQRLGYVSGDVGLHIWAGEWRAATVHQPTDGSSQPLWRVKSWVPNMHEAASLLGKTGTVITLDSAPSWPIFEVNGTESGEAWGPMLQCEEPAHGRGEWTVKAIEYVIVPSATADYQLSPFALLLEPVEVGEIK
jgi:hypothetical protein